MSENVQAYFEMLKKQSSEDLDFQAKELVLNEKKNVTRLIAHIAEIGDRSASSVGWRVQCEVITPG